MRFRHWVAGVTLALGVLGLIVLDAFVPGKPRQRTLEDLPIVLLTAGWFVATVAIKILSLAPRKPTPWGYRLGVSLAVVALALYGGIRVCLSFLPLPEVVPPASWTEDFAMYSLFIAVPLGDFLLLLSYWIEGQRSELTGR